METFLKSLLMLAVALTASTTALAGDGTKDNPYTVSELNAQKESLAASGATVWVKADLRGLGEDGTATVNADTQEAGGKTVHQMAALFSDETGTFIAYSWQILGQLDMADLTNTKNLLIALTYGTAGHPYGNTNYPEYASNEEPEDAHFSLAEVHGALSLNIANGLRGYHINSCYVIPEKVVGVKVSAGYSASKGAYVSYSDFDGADAHVTSKNASLILLAKPANYDFVLTAALHNQAITNGNTLNPGTQAGVNAGTTNNRTRLRFVCDGTKTGFERNSDENCTVSLQSKDEVFLQVSSADNNFYGMYEWETEAKDWITYAGNTWENYADKYASDGIADIKTVTPSSVCYTLGGQRLAQVPAKGLFINNGRKLIAK